MVQTAMQELIQYVESNEIVYNKDLIFKLKEALEKEKEQMFEFADRYVDDVMGGCVLRAYEYFEKHYNQNK